MISIYFSFFLFKHNFFRIIFLIELNFYLNHFLFVIWTLTIFILFALVFPLNLFIFLWFLWFLLKALKLLHHLFHICKSYFVIHIILNFYVFSNVLYCLNLISCPLTPILLPYNPQNYLLRVFNNALIIFP